jgi:hypothetical protein
MQITITGKRIRIQSDTYNKLFNLSDVVVGERQGDNPISLLFPSEKIDLPTSNVISVTTAPLGTDTFEDIEGNDESVRDFLNTYLPLLDLFFLNKGSGSGSTVHTLTYAAAAALVATNGLIAGDTYNITDRGDLGLWLTAITTNEFALNGSRLMLCPATYLTTAFGGNIWNGVWHISKSVNVDDLMIWGGLVWKSKTGTIGTAISDVELDNVNWELIPKSSFTNAEYISLPFDIDFDFANDWIEQQRDGRGNFIGTSIGNWQTNYGGAYNPCDITDWNTATNGGAGNDNFFDNRAIGIFNNDANYYIQSNNVLSFINNNKSNIVRNICCRISNNSCDINANNLGFSYNILNNSCSNYIQENRNAGDINYNSNQGVIFQNSNTGEISYNSNTDEINFNSNKGAIVYNSNQGVISKNSNLGSIDYNTNNGEISGNTAPCFEITNNNCDGNIYGNSNAGNIDGNNTNGHITLNSNKGEILSNNCTNIQGNTNGGTIQNNERGDIVNNSNSYDIYNNNSVSISDNKNTGHIANNTTNVANISSNSNNGSIIGNDIIGDIKFNTNNGFIQENQSSVAVDISKNNNNGNIGSDVATVNRVASITGITTNL